MEACEAKVLEAMRDYLRDRYARKGGRAKKRREKLTAEERAILKRAGGRVLPDGSFAIPLTKENMLPVLNALLVGQGAPGRRPR